MAVPGSAVDAGDLEMETALEAVFLFNQVCLSLRGFDALDEKEFQSLQDIDLVSKSRQIHTLKRKFHLLKGRVQKPTNTTPIRLPDVESSENTYLFPLEELLTQDFARPNSRPPSKSAHDHLIDAIVNMRLLHLRSAPSPDPLTLLPAADQLLALPSLRVTLQTFLANPTNPSGLRLGQAKAAQTSLGEFERLATKGRHHHRSKSSPSTSSSGVKSGALVRYPIKPPRPTLGPQTPTGGSLSLAPATSTPMPNPLMKSSSAPRKSSPLVEGEREGQRGRNGKHKVKTRPTKGLVAEGMDENKTQIQVGKGAGGDAMRENQGMGGNHQPALKPRTTGASVLGERQRRWSGDTVDWIAGG